MMQTALWRVEIEDALAEERQLKREVESLTDINWELAGRKHGYAEALDRAAVWVEVTSGCTGHHRVFRGGRQDNRGCTTRYV